ncbi:MAG: cytochrome-c oxidase, cbb3-type subunit III [Geminicoccaceae bacterium]|nr:cytochrome-c oxidase, cbb3-type subunit III [Geminicoccaceae bacterium]
MADKAERDPVTGVETTGHEWDGIKELDNPMPKWWLYVFYASIVFSVIWWALYPSWPAMSGYFGGIVGYSQRGDLDERMARAEAAQAVWRDKIAALEPEEIAADQELLFFAVAGGEVAFKENCAPCHGLGGAGQLYYPTLADDDWIWGGTMEDIAYTIRHGIRNADDEDARLSEMPAYRRDELLEPQQIEDVANYVLTLYPGTNPGAYDAEAAARGQEVFADNCAACHGEDGGGDHFVGAPALNDAIWLYGGDRDDIVAQVGTPNHGVMPAWQGRLSEDDIKMLTVYVHSLGGGR